MRAVGNIECRLIPAADENRGDGGDVRQMRATLKRIVDNHHVARPKPVRINRMTHG